MKAIASLLLALLTLYLSGDILYHVDGVSMSPAVADGDYIRVHRGVLPERGDIVACHFPNRGRTVFVKRVVAMAGDIVYREKGVTHVVSGGADTALDSEYAAYYPNGAPDDYAAVVLLEDEYFVVGDNVYSSHDSRDWKDASPDQDVGPLTRDMIIGVADAPARDGP